MPRQPIELPFTTDRSNPAPLSAQVTDQLRSAIGNGLLAPGEQLPATRALAAMLDVSRTVITSAYTQLLAEGWIEGRHGSGTYVAKDLVHRVPATTDVAPRQSASGETATGRSGEGAAMWDGMIDLGPGTPWTAGIDRAMWRRHWRRGTAPTPLPYVDPAGLPDLRSALAGYLRRNRGITAAPSQILPTAGMAAGLDWIAATLLRPGDLAGVEEPGYPVARAALAARGIIPVPCRADSNGLVVEELPAGLKLVYTTPAHHFPLGGRLPTPRRQALVDWARRTGALIVEDDYDGEFRYDVAPLPALFGLDPDDVIYLGTTSKMLTPSLGLGWLVAQLPLVSRLTESARTGGIWPSGATGGWPSEPVQRTVASMIVSGDLERHVRRMRHEYRRRRAVMTATLSGIAGVQLRGDEAGVHMIMHTRQDPEHLVAAARDQGVLIWPLRPHFAGPPTCEGIVLGYGASALPDIKRGCQILATILSA